MTDRGARIIAYALVFASGAIMYSAGTIASATNLAGTGIWFLVLGLISLLADCLWPLVSRRSKRTDQSP